MPTPEALGLGVESAGTPGGGPTLEKKWETIAV